MNLQIHERTQGACGRINVALFSIVVNSEKIVLTVTYSWCFLISKGSKVKMDWTVDTRSGNKNDGVMIVTVLKLTPIINKVISEKQV